jgi:hypothetical protein
MRIPSLAGLLFSALIVLVTSGPEARAQYYDDSGRYPTIERFRPAPSYGQRPARQRAAPAYGGGYGAQQPYYPGQQLYYPGMQVYPEARAPAYGGYDRGGGYERGYERRAYQGEARPRVYRRAEPRRRLAPAAPRAAQVKPKVEPSTFLVVFGDNLAEQVSSGLEDAYDEKPEIDVVDETKAETGLVRADVRDWPKHIQDYLSGHPKVTAAIVMLGANDRQAIREGETSHDPLSDRWRELYRDRVDAALRPFVEKRIPFVWVGAPPVKNEKASADLMAINDILRERVAKAGGVYVDIWPGFVNDENRYAPSGPDVEGQTARLRLNDGVQFTTAGARKAAHFVVTELKRIIDEKATGAAVAALPKAPEAAPAAPEQNGPTVAAAPEPAAPAPVVKPPRPIAGPVLPLTKPETSPGGALISSRPKLDGDAAPIAERTLRDGVPPEPKPGRADDFTWPPKS